MSARHIQQHYGFGAARLNIRAEMHRVSNAGLASDFEAMLAEAGSGGPGAIARRFAGSALGMLTTLAFLGFVIAGLVSEEAGREALEVVMLETAEAVPPPIVEPLIEEPIVPEAIVPEPVAPEPVKAEPAPPEPPPMLAEAPPEPARIEPPKPEPVRIQPELAKVEPPPAVRVERPVVRERPVPVAKPRVAIEAVAVAPDRPLPMPNERIARTTVRPEARAVPRMAAPAAPALDLPSEAPAERSFRVAAARAPSAPRGRGIAGVAPAGLPAPVADVPSAPRAPTRGAVARPTAPAASGRSAPRVDFAAAPVAPTAREIAVPQTIARADRAAPPPGGARGASGPARPGLSGVPLGELSACVTDQEEDRLKQAVVAAVETQSECVSGKGTYRFVETKNLNAFLMWIDRAPSRRVEDRCAELRYALECLQGASRRASR